MGTKKASLFRDALSQIRDIATNLKKMLAVAWEMDRRLTVSYALAIIFASLTPLLTSFAMKFLLDNLVGQIQGAATSLPFIAVASLAAFYLAMAVGDFARWGLQRVYLERLFRYRLQVELSRRFYEKTASLDVAYLESPEIQNLISKVRDNLNWRSPIFVQSFIELFGELISYVSAALILISFGWWIPLAVTVSILPRLFLRIKCGTLWWSVYGSTIPEARVIGYLMGLFVDKAAIQEMRIFRAQAAMIAKFKKLQDYLFRRNKSILDQYLYIHLFPPLLEALLLFVIAYLQLPHVLAGSLTVGSFTLLISLTDRLSKSTSNAVSSLTELYEHNLYIGHFFEILSLPKQVREAKDPVIFKKIAPPRIEFKNVSFRYGDGPRVLKNVSFIIEPEQHIALVGPNGAGKTTIIKLLCRFYDATEGEILVNNIDLKKLKLSTWHQHLGTLFQEFVRYKLTVRENIALSAAKGNEGRLRKAAEESAAYDFIKVLPAGFDQMLSREFEDGRELSTGQWQKLAIARAFYHQPPVLILDEPTSALDAEAEYEVFNNLLKSYKDKGLIFVSHRFSTVRNADKIFVIENGRITERGSHEELLKADGKYATMFKCQAEGYK